jgi:hypothetical protein
MKAFDQSNASNSTLLGQKNTSSRCNHTLLVPFKRLERLAILDGRPLPTIDWRDWSLGSDATTEQLENLPPALSNLSCLKELCVEWLNMRFFQSRAAGISQIWRSLTMPRLALSCDEVNGIHDLPKSHFSAISV